MTDAARPRRRLLKRGATSLGVAAVGTLGALSLGHQGPATVGTLAGSSSVPTNATYTQPFDVAGMNLGATATWTAPPTAPATAKAAPSLKGGK